MKDPGYQLRIVGDGNRTVLHKGVILAALGAADDFFAFDHQVVPAGEGKAGYVSFRSGTFAAPDLGVNAYFFKAFHQPLNDDVIGRQKVFEGRVV